MDKASAAQNISVDHAGAKIAISLGGGLFGASWSELAAIAALIYSALCIVEWCWKAFGRGIAERRGWVEKRKRRKEDRES